MFRFGFVANSSSCAFIAKAADLSAEERAFVKWVGVNIDVIESGPLIGAVSVYGGPVGFDYLADKLRIEHRLLVFSQQDDKVIYNINDLLWLMSGMLQPEKMAYESMQAWDKLEGIRSYFMDILYEIPRDVYRNCYALQHVAEDLLYYYHFLSATPKTEAYSDWYDQFKVGKRLSPDYDIKDTEHYWKEKKKCFGPSITKPITTQALISQLLEFCSEDRTKEEITEYYTTHTFRVKEKIDKKKRK